LSGLNESDLSRRAVLRGLAKGAALAALPTWFIGDAVAAEAELQSQRPRRIGPNDTIHVGIIGTGGPGGGYRQGYGVGRGFASKQGVRVVAVCDVDRAHREWAAQEFGGASVAQYNDYRDLLRHRDLDAVIIGTPDHWHALQCVDAMRAGKDVYCEKPLTLTIAEGRDICNVQRQTGRTFQTGSQQRSDARFRLACELVRNGRIGKLSKVTARLPTGPTGGPFDVKPTPEGLDWNMWLGPARMTPYITERVHGNFRWWLEYSGGMLTDWGAHHNDIVQWALGMDDSGPLTVEGSAKNPPMVGSQVYNTFPDYDLNYLYANGVLLHCTNKGDNGVMFEGEGGWIFVTRGRIEASNPRLLEDPLPAGANRLYASNDHIQNFLDCMRNGGQPICNAEVGHRSATVCHMGNISLMLNGRKLSWDARHERFIGDDEANSMLRRQQRKWS
jgi:predicted dehydrogenase